MVTGVQTCALPISGSTVDPAVRVGPDAAGIVGFTRALAYEAAPKGVTVNSIAPGPIETDMLMGLTDDWRAMKQAQLPIGRFGRVGEIAPTALLLASEAGSYYVGQTLSPNGGDVLL